MRIIDRDIEIYEAEVETRETELRRCSVDQEAAAYEKIRLAKAVVQALKELRNKII